MTPHIEKKLRELIIEWRKDKLPINPMTAKYVWEKNQARQCCADNLERCLDELIRHPYDEGQ